MTKFAAGRTYFGAAGQRLTVASATDDKVAVFSPISMQHRTISRAAMEAFAKGSDRRTYHHKSGEIRTKVRADDQEVHYVTPDHQSRVISRADWAKWRKAAE